MPAKYELNSATIQDLCNKLFVTMMIYVCDNNDKYENACAVNSKNLFIAKQNVTVNANANEYHIS